ncbi:RNA polymerase sigma factor [uncultured Hymenobacter sp.]|uniref:RNA polymerase sigma factor n=1 Tax=uncultured Hymenobacter sp. TaxID=170016 RepID=UPI0035C9B83C
MKAHNSREAAFIALHAQYYAMVRQLCRGFMKGDAELAQDLAQEVFLNIWEALPTFKGAASPKTWIYRITTNTCLLYLRTSKRQRALPLTTAPYPVSPDAPEPDADDHARLYYAIGQLAEVDRVLIMLVLEELAYEEIAHITGISSTHLRVKIHRIKKRMKHLLTHAPHHG